MHTVMWMSYDLGVKGDYEGLYAWLDDHGAAECGNSVAFLRYEYSADCLSELKEDIARHVNLDKRDRIYRACRVMEVGDTGQRFQPKEHQVLVLG